MLNRRQAIVASFSAAAVAVLPQPATAVPLIAGPPLYGHDASLWIDAETLRVVLGNQKYSIPVALAGWKVRRLTDPAQGERRR
jgi:hypothetical protein